MKPLLTATIAVLAFAGGAGTMKLAGPSAPPPVPLPANFTPYLSDFVREGSRLAALTAQGTSIDVYEAQYAATTAAYEMLETAWPTNHASMARTEYHEAMRGWKIVLNLWREHTTYPSLKSDASIQRTYALERYAPGKIRYDSNHHALYDENIRILMAVASTYFRNGRQATERD